AAVPLKHDEVEVAMTYGQTRVLAKLGQRHMFYPYPPFGERKRAAVFGPGDMQNSLLGKSPFVRCYDSCVWVSDPGFVDESTETSALARSVNWRKSRLTLMVGGASASEFPGKISQFSTHGSLTFLTSVFPEINNCLVYMPPTSIPSVIQAAGTNDARCAGNFMTAAQGPQDDVICAEDGFGLLLTEARWIDLLGALESRRPLQIPADGEFPGFELLWKV
ncbi:MAG TPA: hypothetical protein VE910_06205, partial [Dongiaceae bacterium]|nr:hypothetical protein [Dongiaceae bacterium]